MKKAGALVVGGIFWLGVGRAPAVPILNIDLDPAISGIQTSLNVAVGATFSVDVVVTHRGTPFDTVILEVLSNDDGVVLGPGPSGPIAGAAAGTQFTIDGFSFTQTSPGVPLTIFPTPMHPPAFASTSGAVGLLAPSTFSMVPPVVPLFSLEFTALAPGTSHILASGPFGDPEFALGAEGIRADDSVPGLVTVLPDRVPVPEPSIVPLLLLGAICVRYSSTKFKGRIKS